MCGVGKAPLGVIAQNLNADVLGLKLPVSLKSPLGNEIRYDTGGQTQGAATKLNYDSKSLEFGEAKTKQTCPDFPQAFYVV